MADKTENPPAFPVQVRKRPDGSTKMFLSRRTKRRMLRETGSLPMWHDLNVPPERTKPDGK
jgi:hypothetical protein